MVDVADEVERPEGSGHEVDGDVADEGWQVGERVGNREGGTAVHVKSFVGRTNLSVQDRASHYHKGN
jgi:hypothetical protein